MRERERERNNSKKDNRHNSKETNVQIVPRSVIQEKLKQKVYEITKELGMKNTTESTVRYLGHKFKPLETDNGDRLNRELRIIKWLMIEFNRTQKVTILGRIVNAAALITTPITFQLHGLHLKSQDDKLLSRIQKKLARQIF